MQNNEIKLNMEGNTIQQNKIKMFLKIESQEK